MTLHLEISEPLAHSIQEIAKRRGRSDSDIATECLSLYWQNYSGDFSDFGADFGDKGSESLLLAKINEGFSEHFWTRYKNLIAKRRAETLTEEEQTELIALSDQLEERNVVRLKYLAELAKRRKTTVRQLMETLGIRPVSVSEISE